MRWTTIFYTLDPIHRLPTLRHKTGYRNGENATAHIMSPTQSPKISSPSITHTPIFSNTISPTAPLHHTLLNNDDISLPKNDDIWAGYGRNLDWNETVKPVARCRQHTVQYEAGASLGDAGVGDTRQQQETSLWGAGVGDRRQQQREVGKRHGRRWVALRRILCKVVVWV